MWYHALFDNVTLENTEIVSDLLLFVMSNSALPSGSIVNDTPSDPLFLVSKIHCFPSIESIRTQVSKVKSDSPKANPEEYK